MTRLDVKAVSFLKLRPHPPEGGIAPGFPRLRAWSPVSKWRPPLRTFCWLIIASATEQAPAFLALEPGFDWGLGRAVDRVGGGRTRQVRTEDRSEPLAGGGGVLGAPVQPGSSSDSDAAGTCSRGFGCDCPGPSWRRCSATEKVTSPWVSSPRSCVAVHTIHSLALLPSLFAASLCLCGLATPEGLIRRQLWHLDVVASLFSASSLQVYPSSRAERPGGY